MLPTEDKPIDRDISECKLDSCDCGGNTARRWGICGAEFYLAVDSLESLRLTSGQAVHLLTCVTLLFVLTCWSRYGETVDGASRSP